MENITRNKFLSILLVLLMLANIATLGTFWYLKLKDDNPVGGGRGSQASGFIIRELALTENQQAVYQELIQQHQEQVQRIRREMRPLKDAFFNSVKDTLLTEKDITEMAGKISEKEIELNLITFYHFQEVRKLGNPQQKLKFDQIISEVMRMMGPRPPRHHSEGPPPGEGFPPPR